jgi:two-component system chemotaxis response regulator CheY
MFSSVIAFTISPFILSTTFILANCGFPSSVRDTPTITLLLDEPLAPYGKCDVAENGQDAINAFEAALHGNEPYDIVCLDIMMPEIDGFEVLDQIKQIEDKKGISGRAGATTSLNRLKDIMKAFKGQCEDYIIKPINQEKFLNKLRQLKLID